MDITVHFVYFVLRSLRTTVKIKWRKIQGKRKESKATVRSFEQKKTKLMSKLNVYELESFSLVSEVF